MNASNPHRAVHLRLGLTAAAILFLELLLIRWVSTEVNIFAYLQNSILVVCFLGLGMGLLYPKAGKATLTPAILCLTGIVVVLSVDELRRAAAFIATSLSLFHDFVIWEQWETDASLWAKVGLILLGLGPLMALSAAVWGVMVPLGRALGQLFEESPRIIVAYSYDIGGSLIGIWLFTLLGYWALPPAAWAFVAACLLAPLCERRLWPVLALLPIIAFIGYNRGDTAVYWTPYQKIELQPFDAEPGEYKVITNNSGFQQIQNNAVEIHKEEADALALSQYDLAARFHPDPKTVLIAGVGTGNDLAAAIRRAPNASITGVEIDPLIAKLGKEFHPERPYQHPSVRLEVNDARASFHTLPAGSVDLLITGLLDSHTTPNLSNARLDNFIYTKESLSAAARLLSPTGVMVVSFSPQRPYIVQRLQATLDEIFGSPTLMIHLTHTTFGWGGLIFVNGNQQTIRTVIEENPDIRKLLDLRRIETSANPEIRPTSDNWPYLYMERPTIPTLFYLLAGVIVLLWVLTSRRFAGRLVLPPLQQREPLHFFALGAGFILMQVFVITKASLLFGSTWIVNSVVISGMMLTILVANFCIYRGIRIGLHVVGLVMIALCCTLAVVSFEPFLSFSLPWRIATGILISGAPTLLSGLLFGSAFQSAQSPSAALGANLFGSLVGAMVQSVVFWLGINSLALLGAAAYAVAFLTLGRALQPSAGSSQR